MNRLILFFILLINFFVFAENTGLKIKIKRIPPSIITSSSSNIIKLIRKPPSKKRHHAGIIINISRYKKIHPQSPTFYYTAFEHTFSGKKTNRILDSTGRTISACKSDFYRFLVQQGSGILEDGRSINIVRGERFQLLPKNCLGITKSGYRVIPYHTLAVNPREMPYGNVYFIPKTRGIRLPNGTIHDGFWFAHDTGAAFTGTIQHKIDLYVKNKTGQHIFESKNIKSHHPIKIYQVDYTTRLKVYKKYKRFLINENKRKRR